MVPVQERPFGAVPDRPAAVRFAECVRTVSTVAKRARLVAPVYLSPPRLSGVDRSIRRRPGGSVVVAVRLAGRPFAAIQADVVEGVVAANRLEGEPADRFRRSAWAALEGTPPTRDRRPAHLRAAPDPAKVA